MNRAVASYRIYILHTFGDNPSIADIRLRELRSQQKTYIAIPEYFLIERHGAAQHVLHTRLSTGQTLRNAIVYRLPKQFILKVYIHLSLFATRDMLPSG